MENTTTSPTIDITALRAELDKTTKLTFPLFHDELVALLDLAEGSEAVRELHTKEKHGVRWHCGECLQDDNTGSWEYVEWPCATIRALDC